MKPARKLLLLGVAAAVACGPGAAGAAEIARIKMGNLAFPSLISVILSVVKDQALDRKHNVELEMHPFSAPSAQLAAQATGETDAGPNGPLVLQKMRLEGAPLQVVATLAGLSAMVVISRNPEVRALADLRGRSLAADVGSAEFQILDTYARSKGLDLRRDLSLVPAAPPLARAQLSAGRVDAAMTWEPSATLTMRDSADYRVIFNGGAGWRELTGQDGWELVISMREDFARSQPQAVAGLVGALQDARQFIATNPDDADRIASRAVSLPPGVLKEALRAGRIAYDPQPAWAPAVRDSLWTMFKAAVAGGYLKAMPQAAIIYSPN